VSRFLSRVLDRTADAGGILYLLLAGVGYGVFVSASMPQELASPPAVLAYLHNHPPGTAFWVGVGMEAAGLLFLLLFAARLAGRIRTADPAGWIGSAVLGLAVAAFAVKLASFAPALAALHAGRYDAGTVTALLDSNNVSDYVSSAIDGTFVVLAGLGALTVGALPRWLAASGVVAGVATIVGVAVPDAFDSVQLLLFLWLVTTSVWLLARGRRTAPAPRPLPSPTGESVPA
jgi:hypothetical protein